MWFCLTFKTMYIYNFDKSKKIPKLKRKKKKSRARKGSKPVALRNRQGTWETDLFTTFGSKAGRQT